MTRTRKWVLIVDDEAGLRTVWIEALEQAGYAAVGCQDGLEAAELIRDLFPDLILLDLRMPRASGWDFLEIVRANAEWHRIPIVIVSGYLADGPVGVGDPGLNIVGRMAKPLSIEELLAAVGDVIGPGVRA